VLGCRFTARNVNIRTFANITGFVMAFPLRDFYRQHCAQRKAPVYELLTGRFCFFFARQERHVAPMGMKFGTDKWTKGPLLPPYKFYPHRCNDNGIRPPKLKFLLRIYNNSEYKRPAGAYSLRDFHEIYRVCTSFQRTLTV